MTRFKKHSTVVTGLLGICIASYAYAAGTAVQVEMVDNLSATVRGLLNSTGAYVIDGIIIGAAGYGAALTRNPSSVIFGLISCAAFHIGIKLLG